MSAVHNSSEAAAANCDRVACAKLSLGAHAIGTTGTSVSPSGFRIRP